MTDRIPTLTNARLPQPIEDAICNVSDEHLARSLRHYLGFGGDKGMRDTFLEMLAGKDINVHEDQAETDPEEIVVRATGTLANGSYCRDLNIILLDPWWSKRADVSHAMASRIIEVWDEITKINDSLKTSA